MYEVFYKIENPHAPFNLNYNRQNCHFVDNFPNFPKKSYSRYLSDGYIAQERKKHVETFYVELVERDIEPMLRLSGYEIDEGLTRECLNLAGNNIVYVAFVLTSPFKAKIIPLIHFTGQGYKQKKKIYYPKLEALFSKLNKHKPLISTPRCP